MTDLRIALLDLLRKYQDDGQLDVLREGVRLLAQLLMELEVSHQVGAERYERSPQRKTYRNGYRERDWDTRVGTITLRIPKLREGSYFPSLLEPRRRAEKALLSVVQEAYIEGVSTRKVDELVKALGMEGISKSQVSRLCQELDNILTRFRERELTCEYPYVWLDAKAVKARQDGRVVNMAAVVAVGVRETGEREVLGYDIGQAESYEFWSEFLRHLVRRGLKGVRLVISDAHEGLKQAIAEILAGASWQRCRVHFMRNLLAHVPKQAQAMVAALIRTIFVQPDVALAREQLEKVADSLRRRFPKVAERLLEAADDVLTYMAFPPEHWRQIYSTNPLERLLREIGRRTDVVHLPQRRRGLAADRGGSAGAARRVDGISALLQSRVDGETLRSSATDRERKRGDTPTPRNRSMTSAGETGTRFYSCDWSQAGTFVRSRDALSSTFSGERTPLNDPQARGLVFGLTLSHSRAHLYRALLESVGYGIRHHLDVLREAGMPPRRLRAVGGGTKNPLWLQVVSDICGQPQEVPEVTTGAAYGDAFLAGLGVGVFSSHDAINTWVRERMRVEPDPANAARYEPLYEIYRELYRRNKDLMHELTRLQ